MTIFEKPPEEITEDFRLKVKEAEYVCQSCGEKYGKGISRTQKQRSLSTWSTRVCDICGEDRETTQFRDFGYALPEFYTP